MHIKLLLFVFSWIQENALAEVNIHIYLQIAALVTQYCEIHINMLVQYKADFIISSIFMMQLHDKLEHPKGVIEGEHTTQQTKEKGQTTISVLIIIYTLSLYELKYITLTEKLVTSHSTGPMHIQEVGPGLMMLIVLLICLTSLLYQKLVATC